MKLIKITFVLFFLTLLGQLSAQKSSAYQLVINAPSTPDTVLYLGRYHGHKTYLVDTAYRDDRTQSYTFSGNTALPEGLYLIANDAKQNLLDVVISKVSHHFTIKAPKGFDIRDVKFVGSKENKYLQSYLKTSIKHYDKVKPLRDRLPILQAKNSDSVALIRKALHDVSVKTNSARHSIIHKTRGGVVSDILELLNSIEDDKTYRLQCTNAQGQLDSLKWFYTKKNNYWNRINLKSSRVLRNPFIPTRIDEYFDNYVFFEADSVQLAIDDFMHRVEGNQELYVYVLWHLLNKYEQSQVMGHDAILVHMADVYFKDSIAGVHPVIAQNIIKKAEERRPILIGKKAPNIIGRDTALKERALYNLQSDFTVVAFWNPACSHCRDEMPELNKYYLKNKDMYNLSVMGVSTSPDPISFAEKVKAWDLDFCNVFPITERQTEAACNFKDIYNVDATPLMYLLDKDKNIIAKHFGVEHIDLIIKNYVRMHAE